MVSSAPCITRNGGASGWTYVTGLASSKVGDSCPASTPNVFLERTPRIFELSSAAEVRSVGPYSSTTASTALDSSVNPPASKRGPFPVSPNMAAKLPAGAGSDDPDPRGIDV